MPDLTSEVGAVVGTVSGWVQGVGFRYSTEWKARRLHLTGWVRNLRDGRVELFAQGDPGQLAALEEWLAIGPPAARVEAVSLHSVDPDRTITSFEIR